MLSSPPAWLGIYSNQYTGTGGGGLTGTGDGTRSKNALKKAKLKLKRQQAKLAEDEAEVHGAGPDSTSIVETETGTETGQGIDSGVDSGIDGMGIHINVTPMDPNTDPNPESEALSINSVVIFGGVDQTLDYNDIWYFIPSDAKKNRNRKKDKNKDMYDSNNNTTTSSSSNSGLISVLC